MKKILFIFLIMFFLTGCDNSITIDFKDNINTKIDLSFTLNEYNNYSEIDEREELISSIEAIRNDKEAFINGNGELFIEKSFTNTNDYYNASYEYNYNYYNFKDNSVLHTCFDYFGTTEDVDNIYISIKGKSKCSRFKLVVKGEDRIISSNAKKVNDEYIWNIQEENNDIFLAVSKNKVSNNTFNVWNTIYFIMALIIGVSAFIINNKMTNK